MPRVGMILVIHFMSITEAAMVRAVLGTAGKAFIMRLLMRVIECFMGAGVLPVIGSVAICVIVRQNGSLLMRVSGCFRGAGVLAGVGGVAICVIVGEGG